MRESRVKENFTKLLMLKVCLPTVYKKIGGKRIDAIEECWATEADYIIVDDLVGPEIDETIVQLEFALSSCKNFEEMMQMIESYNHFLYIYVKDSDVSTEKELHEAVKMYYNNIREAVRFGVK